MHERSAELASREGRVAGRVADADGERCHGKHALLRANEAGRYATELPEIARSSGVEPGCASPVNGFWRDADWLGCRDGKWRPVEPGTFPLVDGAADRVGRLRGYGNAIVAPVAQAFIESYLSVIR